MYTSRSISSSSARSGPGRRAVGSVYGGAGGSGVRISSASGGSQGAGFEVSEGLDMNEKGTMQNLNDRLATYLEKVRSLEKSNADLEMKIRNFLDNRTSISMHDSSAHRVTIAGLQEKIVHAAHVNASLFLSVDNAKLAADDFKVKYENELAMRQSVEADIMGLKRALDELTRARSGLDMELEGLKDDLFQIKRQHEEDLMALRSNMGGSVNVEVDAAPQQDLSLVMAGIREHYEGVADKNRRELEAWFQTKSTELNKDMASSTETLKSSRTEISELRRTLDTLQIKLQAQLSKKGAREANLAEVNERFAMMMQRFQQQVVSLEEQLSSLRGDLANQKEQYNILLDIKTRLELEIAEYRRLLDGENEKQSVTTTTTRTKVVTIIQEVDEHGNVIG